MRALLIVDVQNDFCPGGALPAFEGDKVIPVINQLMDRFKVVIASRDWHPINSVHFKKWPVHCVRGTIGAEFHPSLKTEKINLELLKGTTNKDNGYSAFEATNIDLQKYLKQNNIDELYITGLTTEYCVRASAMDAIKSGLKVFIVKDAIKGVNAVPYNSEKAIKEMKEAGIEIINSNNI